MADCEHGDGAAHLNQPGILEVLCDEDALAAWELVRRARFGLSVQEIAGCLGLPLPPVCAAVDRLEAAHLVEPRRAGRGRNFVTYRTTAESLQVSVDDIAHADLSVAIERIHAVRVARFSRLAAPATDDDAHGNGPWRCCAHASADLLPEEIERIRAIVSRIEEIFRFATRRGERGEDSGKTPAAVTPYVLLVQASPAAGAAPPLPDVRFVRNRDGDAPPPTPANGTLSPRERQVADGLASGLTRVKIAEQLGLSVHTVGTLTRRVYRKLGARNRAEMVRSLRP